MKLFLIILAFSATTKSFSQEVKDDLTDPNYYIVKSLFESSNAPVLSDIAVSESWNPGRCYLLHQKDATGSILFIKHVDREFVVTSDVAWGSNGANASIVDSYSDRLASFVNRGGNSTAWQNSFISLDRTIVNNALAVGLRMWQRPTAPNEFFRVSSKPNGVRHFVSRETWYDGKDFYCNYSSKNIAKIAP